MVPIPDYRIAGSYLGFSLPSPEMAAVASTVARFCDAGVVVVHFAGPLVEDHIPLCGKIKDAKWHKRMSKAL